MPPANGLPSTRGSSTRSQPRFAARTDTRGLFDPTILPALEAAGYDRSFELLTDRTAVAARRLACGRAHRRRPEPGQGSRRAGRRRRPRRDRQRLRGNARARRDAGRLARRCPEGSSISAATSPSGAAHPKAGPGAWTSQTREGASRVAWNARARRAAASRRPDATRGGSAPASELHHLIDPATGEPAAAGPLAVTVVAASATEAEAYATALGSRRSTMRATSSPLAPTSQHCSSRSSASPSRSAPLRLARDRPARARRQHPGRTVPMALKARFHRTRSEARRRRSPPRHSSQPSRPAAEAAEQRHTRRAAIGRRLHPPGHHAVLPRPDRPALGHTPSRRPGHRQPRPLHGMPHQLRASTCRSSRSSRPTPTRSTSPARRRPRRQSPSRSPQTTA